MNTNRDVAVLVGSLRKDSLNRKLANALIALAPVELKLEIVEIGDLPLYNQDFEVDPPHAVRKFKGRIEVADAVLFVTPEYNRSVPGVLKNAIDIGSRPSGKVCGTVSLAQSSASHQAPSGRSAPITICVSRWYSSTSRPWRSRKPTSATR